MVEALSIIGAQHCSLPFSAVLNVLYRFERTSSLRTFIASPNVDHQSERLVHSLQSANLQRLAFSSHYLVRGHPLPSHPTTKQMRKFSCVALP
ncbi:hypothetical protein FXN63_13900 [Pigmentiphaga aceris]|uniref:Uncharacterized protein n=1 Tax=Pigmentiphaga aceris TaxID=1940612 RepID=A0A5C0AXE5_9BURK|nr:hypothetical protein [Pigmentiphaga aceris]QEI06805.1 hypothetical protein FXN63_13900 [Pigmentiphaga aceris]